MYYTIKGTVAVVARLALAAAISTFVLGAAVSPADAAGVDSDTVSRVVTTAGLHLTRPVSSGLLRQRLAAAARHICRDKDVHGLDPNAGFAGCYQDAMKGAWVQAATIIARAQGRSEVAFAGH